MRRMRGGTSLNSLGQAQCRGVLRLVQMDIASAGKRDRRYRTPPCFMNFGGLHAFRRERSDFGFQFVAHEVKLVGAILIGRMEGGLGGRQREDQPAVPRIDGFEAEDVAEKGAVSFGILTLDNYVSARNHLRLLRNFGPPTGNRTIEMGGRPVGN